MYSEQTTDNFREAYRAAISPIYNGYVHMAFVVLVALTYIVYQLQRLGTFHWYYLAGMLATLVLWNFLEYFIHIKLGHNKTKYGALFYKRHTGDHHSFFTEKRLVPGSHKDWRVTLFPAWLVVVTAAIASGTGVLVGWVLGQEWGIVFSAGLMVGYLAYEFFHFCDHLPQHHFLVRLPWIGHMRHLHKLHHRRDLMTSYNFNLTFPLADWCFGTFYWIPPEQCEKEVQD